MEETFQVIRFTMDEDNSCDIIHKNWLISLDHCRWPGKGENVPKLRLCGELNSKWDIHSIQILYSTDKFENAVKKLKLYIDGAETSDLLTEDTDAEKAKSRKRRRRVSFSSDSEDENSRKQKHSRKQICLPTFEGAPSITQVLAQDVEAMSSASPVNSAIKSQIQVKASCDCDGRTQGMIERLMTEVIELKKEIKKLQSVSQSSAQTLEDDFPTAEILPIKDEASFHTMEKNMEEIESKQKMVKWLSSRCTNSRETIVGELLHILIHPSFAKMVNWSGANRKIKLCTSWVYHLIFGLVNKKNISCSRLEVQKLIMAHIKKMYDAHFQRIKSHNRKMQEENVTIDSD